MTSTAKTRVDFTEQIKIFREDYVSVVIYRNVNGGKEYYDVVISRLIWERQADGTKRRCWKRGANFKPEDCPVLGRLLSQAYDLVNDPAELARLSGADVDVSRLV